MESIMMKEFAGTDRRCPQSARRMIRPGYVAVLVLGLLTACSQVEPVQPTVPITDPTQLYLRLALNYSAINLTADSTVSAHNEVQLVATPYDGTGAVIADAPAATFTVSDTGAVRVDANGLLHAKRATAGATVVASLVLGGARHVDTALVTIVSTASPPVLDTFSIHVPADSAAWYVPSQTDEISTLTESIAQFSGLTGPAALPVHAVDGSGTPLPALAIEYASLDSAVAIVDRWTGAVTPLGAGRVPVVARTFAYGVAKADTMTYMVNPPLTGDIRIDQQGFYYRENPRPAAPTLRIVAGGIVGWFSITGQLTDVTFDEPTAVTAPPDAFCDFLAANLPPGAYCAAANIAAFNLDSTTYLAADGGMPWRFRRFPVPGTYPYHSTTTGAAGTIVVLDRVMPLP